MSPITSDVCQEPERPSGGRQGRRNDRYRSAERGRDGAAGRVLAVLTGFDVLERSGASKLAMASFDHFDRQRPGAYLFGL